MKKRRPNTYFSFETQLSPEEFLAQLQLAIEAYNATCTDWLLFQIPAGSHNRFRIGLQRAGHSGGYWYCGTIHEEGPGCQITGNIVRNPDENDVEILPEKPIVKHRLGTVIVWILFGIPILFVLAVVLLCNAICNLFRKRPAPKPTKEALLLWLMTDRLPCQLLVQHD